MSAYKNELILINGPHFVDVNCYLKELETYEEIFPSDIFSKNPSFGLRDIGLKIVHHIQQDRKVVVFDGNELRRVRESYIKLLRKKCNNSNVRVINVFPKFGCSQLFWAQEYRLAENVPNSTTQIRIADPQILKWFEKESDINIFYKAGIVDAVKESEDCSVETHYVDLSAKSVYKWEVPALFIQWELVMCEDNNRQIGQITDVLFKWAERYPYGRIIFICDGNRIRTGEKTKQQESSDIKNKGLQICQNFTGGVVYVYHIDDPNQAGSYVQSPKPGILAFLQRRHALNLHSKSTVYLYETTDHMKMAENAGVRHIKGTKTLRNSALVVSQSAATIPPVPDMLKSLDLQPDESNQLPSIPLFDKKDSYHGSMICSHVCNGRTEYVFVKKWEIFQKLQDLHVKLSTKVGLEGNKMSPQKIDQSEGFTPHTSDFNQSKASMLSRDLPKWMLGKEGSSKSSKSSLESLESGDHDKSSRKTLYMMTDHELVETACEVLKQAGKTEIIDLFKSKLKRKEDEGRTKEKISSKKRHPTVCAVKKRKYNESSSSLCPKMEPEEGDFCLKDEDPINTRNKMIKTHQENVKDSNQTKQRRTKFENYKGSNDDCLNKSSIKKRQMAGISDDLDDIDDSQESVGCLSTESSQDGSDSTDLGSEDEEIVGNVQACDVEVHVKEKSETQNVVKCDTNKHNVLLNSKITRPSQTSSPGKGPVNSRRHRTPDLSILDEIFS